MIGASALFNALARVTRVKADAVSAVARAGGRRAFRFAHDAIHQDLAQETFDVTVSVLREGRVGIASTGSPTPAALKRCAETAADIATHAPQPDRLPAWPARSKIRSRVDDVRRTSALRPEACVAAIQHLMRACQGLGVELAGSLLLGEEEIAVANSRGTACYSASTVAGAKLVTLFGALSGFASGVHRDWEQLGLERLLQRSLRQSHRTATLVSPPLGEYEVILEPDAVADLLEWLGYTAFGAKALEERTSFLAGRIGERLMDPTLTIYDDGTEMSRLRLPFDFEGMPRQRVVLVDRGQAAGVVYDTAYGAKFGRSSTGHAALPGDTEGPLPMHLAIAPGRGSLEGMVRACKQGLLIPRFHYVNGLLNPREAVMTGLTREGACLIRNGRLAEPVTTLRFTQSIVEAFRHVLDISRERRLVADPSSGSGSALVPAVRLARFAFTGRSGG